MPELEEWVVVCLRGITVRRTGVRFGLGLGLGLGLGAIVSWGRDQAITASRLREQYFIPRRCRTPAGWPTRTACAPRAVSRRALAEPQ